MDIENPTAESLSIEWKTINYNQVENLHQICLLSIVDLFKKYKK